jgi:putative transcriptional regulator
MVMLKPQQIRAIRLALGLKPTEFAGRIGVSDNTVRRWEIGDRRPSGAALTILRQLADEAAAKGKPVLQPA